MTSIPFFVLDAFTETPFQGNPAGVFFDDDSALSAEQMRQLAGEVHLESAFVLPAGDSGADFRIRYFTGVIEVPLCGHATVAALTALGHMGRISANVVITFATTVGILSAAVADDGAVTLYQSVAELGPICNKEQVRDVAFAVGCSEREISPSRLPVQRVSTGTPWLLAPVKTKEAVDAAPGDLKAIARISRETNTFGIYLFCIDVDRPGHDSRSFAIWSRCFAPIAGLDEDPVTGSASGALGVYLVQHRGKDLAAGQFVYANARQGFAGGRGGTVKIVARRNATGAIDPVAVTGRAVLVAEGAFTVR